MSFCRSYAQPRDLHSFPTRRSSDLGAVEHVLQFPAAQLLMERAAMARPGFCLRSGDEALAVARICQRLDGIPLALELAADRKSTRLNSSHVAISYAVFCLKKKTILP